MNPQEVAERCIREPDYAWRINREAPEAIEHVYPHLEAECERNPELFCKLMLGFKPKDYQAEVLHIDYNQDIAARWVRQGGKTYTFGAKTLHYVWYHPNSTFLIVAPSMRQSLLFRDKMEPHIINIPERLRKKFFFKIQRTKIVLRNGSVIYVLPNSLDLIRGFTAHIVLCDEFAMFKDPDTLLDGVVGPMFNTTNGKLWLLSTPKGKGHRFYEICHSAFYYQHHINWRRGVEGGLTRIEAVWRYLQKKLPPEAKIEGQPTIQQVDEVLKKYGTPREFEMEYEAEFIEDLDTFFSYDLISRAIDTSKTRKENYYEYDSIPPQRNYYAGLDLGKEIDNSVLIIIEQNQDKFNVIHKKIFPLGTDYGSVIGNVRYISERWKTLRKTLVDQTGVGEFPAEEMKKTIQNVTGIKFTLPQKEEIANYTKQQLIQGKILIPYDSQLIDGLNVERYEFTKDGRLRLFHSEGDHDDIFWAFCLAVYASKPSEQTGGVVIKI